MGWDTGVVEHNMDLGKFLRARRGRLNPTDVGFRPTVNTRRVPGLRREEVAQLAGVSADYYARLEQGRHPNVSESVLTAVARALRLDDVERRYLIDLARAKVRPVPLASQNVRPELQRVLETIGHNTPAMVLNHRQDVLASNHLVRVLIADFHRAPPESRNLARFILLDPEARRLYADWEEVAGVTIANLRLAAGSHPDDPKLNELIGELSVKSSALRAMWSSFHVDQCAHGSQRFLHPLTGELTLYHETLVLPADLDQSICLYTAKPGSDSAEALTLLASWTAEDDAVSDLESRKVKKRDTIPSNKNQSPSS
ncbi:helix-turn-helix transcriptional regulator [Paenarthrobacter sp. NPDC057981]|uniref:helix-turn-helix transcriptional regulator n=1 Tax=Paenarthrobacter sp. NPDC057981 TaxID=3346297 RepID=UPI0036DE0A05